MDFLNFVVGLHAETGVEVPESDYPKLATLEGCVAYLGAAVKRPKRSASAGSTSRVSAVEVSEPAQDHDRHRAVDLAAGPTGGERDRQQAEARHQRGHRDRHDPLARAAQRRRAPPARALDVDQVLEVREHHDRVARGDAEQCHEPDQRAEREAAPRRGRPRARRPRARAAG